MRALKYYCHMLLLTYITSINMNIKIYTIKNNISNIIKDIIKNIIITMLIISNIIRKKK